MKTPRQEARGETSPASKVSKQQAIQPADGRRVEPGCRPEPERAGRGAGLRGSRRSCYCECVEAQKCPGRGIGGGRTGPGRGIEEGARGRAAWEQGPGNRAAANMPRWTRGLHGSRIRGLRYGKCAETGGRTARGPGPGGNARAAWEQNPGNRGRAGGGSRQGFASAGAGRAGIFFEGLLTFLRTYWTAPGLSLTNDGVLLIMPRMVMMRPAGGAGGVTPCGWGRPCRH